MIGSVPGLPNPGLPALYNVYEASLLVDEGFVDVVDRRMDHEGGYSEEDRLIHEAYKSQCFEHQRAKWTSKDRDIRSEDHLYHIPFQKSASDGKRAFLAAPDPKKYKIFRDLWKLGNFVTMGNTFGGDFLVYPDDPMLCHATHVVHVLDEPKVSANDFINCNRLCVGVKKVCIYAYVHPGTNPIVYQSSKWMLSLENTVTTTNK